MRLLVAHENLDFDALGSLLCAQKLHPGHQAVWLGGLEGRMRQVFALHEDLLGLQHLSDMDLEGLEEVVVLDTARPERLGRLADWVGRVPFVVYDHHPPAPGDLPSVGGVWGATGSTVALLVPLLVAQGLSLDAVQASLAYAGVWEDTGGFSYPATSQADLEAAATLVAWGAQPAQVTDWVRERYGPEARHLLQALIDSAQITELPGFRLLYVHASQEGYIPALAPLAHTLLDLFDTDAILMALTLANDPILIARSRKDLDVGAWLTAVGGGGHRHAAFARLDRPLDQVYGELMAALPQYLPPVVHLEQRMSRGVQSLGSEFTVGQALEELRRRGYGGMPVVDSTAQGSRVWGMARRKDLERAVLHGLADRSVRTVLTPAVVLAPETPLHQAEEALRQGSGRLLVGRPVAAGHYELLGVFTRTDLYRQVRSSPPSEIERLWQALPQGVRQILEYLRQRFPGGGIYLVGGAVRDAWLGAAGPDLDLAVEPPLAVEELARALVQQFGGQYTLKAQFATARVRLEFGLEVDLATTREEVYPHPGALPQVRPASLARDLERRDFTVNALALRIAEPLELLDPLGGVADLVTRCLRPLHPLSFVEDPSRLVRGARLAARLGLHLLETARSQIPAALEEAQLAHTSVSRLRDELWLTLPEASGPRALEILHDWGALEALYGLTLNDSLLEGLRSMAGKERAEAQRYLLLWFHPHPAQFSQRFALPRRYLEGVQLLHHPPDHPRTLHQWPGLAQVFAFLFPQRSQWLFSPPRVVQGRTLLELGLPGGPAVGRVLRALQRAREQGEVSGYEAELQLARKLVNDELRSAQPPR